VFAHLTAGNSGEKNRGKPFVRIDSPGRDGGSSTRRDAGERVQLTIGGELSMATLPQIWPRVEEGLRGIGGVNLAVNVEPMECSDSSCLALFAEIRRLAAVNRARLDITGLPPEFKALLDLSMLPDATETQLHPPPAPGIIASIGEMTAHRLRQAGAMITFIGELFAGVAWALTHPHQVRWREALLSVEKAGADALPVVLLLGFLIGVMLAFQSAEQTERYGVRTIIPNVVAVAVTRELGPLIAMLLLAGRTGSAYAAELGTMKVNQELSALRAMGLNPVRFLAVPRVLGLILVAPLLTIFCDLAGIIGGYTVLADHGFSFLRYAVQIGHALNWPDVCGGLGKTIVGGLLIGAAGCFYGIHTGNASRDVGSSTTRAVVSSIILIVAIDGSFGVIYYYFGI
jgi:phospholipid/cholesterol/gamma-HCH transport system permease protein